MKLFILPFFQSTVTSPVLGPTIPQCPVHEHLYSSINVRAHDVPRPHKKKQKTYISVHTDFCVFLNKREDKRFLSIAEFSFFVTPS